jgi:hypothetical protein
MIERRVIAGGTGVGFRLNRGQQLRVIDPEGGQSGDLFACSADGRERLSNGRTFDYQGRIHLSTGDVLWSDRSRPMLTILADDVGRHDFLYAACTVEMYRLQYGVAGHHANCADNIADALRSMGLEPGPPPTAFNIFMRADVARDGSLTIAPPASRAGDSIVLRAEMDLAVALTACPASICNGGAPPRPLAYAVEDVPQWAASEVRQLQGRASERTSDSKL